MRMVRTVLLAGVAAIGVVGICGMAVAKSPAVHTLTIQLPGGGVERIRYTGNVAPKVSVMPMMPAAFAPASFFWGDPAFARLQNISAAMDRQMDAMLMQTQDMMQQSFAPLSEATLKGMPAGSSSYSFVSTMGGNGFCSRSVQITSSGNGRPQVVSHSSGNCGSGAAGLSAPAVERLSPSQVGLQTISAKASQNRGTLHDAVWHQN